MERPEIDYWTEKQPFCDIRECCDIQDVKKLEAYADHLESQLETLKAEKQEAVELLRESLDVARNGGQPYRGVNHRARFSTFLSKQDGE